MDSQPQVDVLVQLVGTEEEARLFKYTVAIRTSWKTLAYETSTVGAQLKLLDLLDYNLGARVKEDELAQLPCDDSLDVTVSILEAGPEEQQEALTPSAAIIEGKLIKILTTKSSPAPSKPVVD